MAPSYFAAVKEAMRGEHRLPSPSNRIRRPANLGAYERVFATRGLTPAGVTFPSSSGVIAMKRIMYVERKGDSLDGPGRICWVELSRSKRSYRYRGRELLRCVGYKYNCIDVETRERYWVSGPKRNGLDKLYGGMVEIDDDARVEYWMTIRNRPDCVLRTTYRG